MEWRPAVGSFNGEFVFHFSFFFLLLVFFAIAFLGFLSYIARDFDFSLELESQSRSIRPFSDDV